MPKKHSSTHSMDKRGMTVRAKMNRCKLAVLVLTVAVIPLFYLSIWSGLAASLTIYALLAKLANEAFDRQSRKAVIPFSRRQKL